MENQKQLKLVRREKIQQFIESLQGRENLISAFDETLFRATMESITVYTAADIRVEFRDGSEETIDSRLKKYAE